MKIIKKIINRLRWTLAIRWGVFTDASSILEAVRRQQTAGNLVMLNLGCGTRFHGDWINIDFRGDGDSVYTWDLRSPLPLPDHCCDAIYASHVIEHFNRDGARKLLNECRRLLKPSGVVRLVAPDLEGLARCYLETLDAARLNQPWAAAHYDWIIIEMIDQLVRHHSGGEMLKYWAQDNIPEEDFVAKRVGAEYSNALKHSLGHRLNSKDERDPKKVGSFRLGGEVHLWMYDTYSLGRLLEECGFKCPVQRTANESAIELFESYYLDADAVGITYKPDSFFIEAFAH
jgi:predicted SAM-dependent methyltransferase